ncbi:MAG: low temperature requirement protein A [Sphingomonadaceae bacterium]|nr:low temperature requirement protein A [Sphingomonadaceae bacterium]
MTAKGAGTATSLLRASHGGHQPVGFAELFFDLVYVFAITQLSHFWLAHHDAAGVLQFAILFLSIWWAWIFMVWTTNWLDPDRAKVRLMIFLVMGCGLVISAAVPQAFGARALPFVGAYIALQTLRCLWIAWVTRERPGLSRNMLRAAIWFLFSAPFWLAGVWVTGANRTLFWLAAIAIEYVAPVLLFHVPGLGKSTTSDFQVAGGHMAERCALFIIIALGEGILLTGATFADQSWTPTSIAAFAVALFGSIAMWWVYFDIGMQRASDHIAQHADSGRVARYAYTYLHMPICAGIVLCAAADEMLLAHPTHHAEPLFIGTLLGGIALFLVGTMFFKRATSGRPWLPLSHGVGMLLLLLLAVWGLLAPPSALAIAAASAAILAIVALWEWGSHNGGWRERGFWTPRWAVRRAQMAQQAADTKPPA